MICVNISFLAISNLWRGPGFECPGWWSVADITSSSSRVIQWLVKRFMPINPHWLPHTVTPVTVTENTWQAAAHTRVKQCHIFSGYSGGSRAPTVRTDRRVYDVVTSSALLNSQQPELQIHQMPDGSEAGKQEASCNDFRLLWTGGAGRGGGLITDCLFPVMGLLCNAILALGPNSQENDHLMGKVRPRGPLWLSLSFVLW